MEVRVSAKLFIVNTNKKLLLLQRSASDPRRPLEWDIPGGHVDDTEFTEEAAAREALEETGLVLDNRSMKLVATRSTIFDAAVSVHWLFYLVEVQDEAITLSSEHQAYQWANVADALQLLSYDVQHEALEYAVKAGFFS